MATTTTIPTLAPKSHGIFSFVVTDSLSGALVSGATATIAVYNPSGILVSGTTAPTVTENPVGTYYFTVLPTWSVNEAGNIVEGEYMAEVVVTKSGIQRYSRLRYRVTLDAS